ncbi:hypothetical protein C8J56DRAFT_895484 [Mycena floridula]|nr:hypothetical protein C8J56DRAFT_895484 [Mycena floridula]
MQRTINPSGISAAGQGAYSACLPLLHHTARVQYTHDRAVELDRQAQKFLNSAIAESITFSRDKYLRVVQARWAFDVSEDYERLCMEEQQRHLWDQSRVLDSHNAANEEPEGNHLTLDQRGEFSGPPSTQQWRENSPPDIEMYPPTDQRYHEGQRTPRQVMAHLDLRDSDVDIGVLELELLELSE